uniref:Apolipoprotein B-100 n=1 Tax=Larimichthys crocea TaxID=215358 RepID=A0A0F8C306_LARCR
MKYNRRKNVITADIQIPDYDVEAGLRLGVVDGNTKGKGTHSISLDFINKNIPQLSLVGRANLKAMKEGMLQVQLLVPSIKADATVTANMKRDEELELELKSEIKIMDTTAEQKITLKYDTSKIEVDLKSNVNSELLEIRSYAEEIKKYGKDVLAIRVGKTDMTVSQIIKAFVEATNNHMEKYGADIPYIQNFRVPDIPEISLPETLFLNTEAKAVYTFNNERFTIAIPLPLGGKSTEELNFPPALTTPHVSLQQFGLEIVSMEIPIPNLVVPKSLTLSIPLFGKTEVSALMRSNLYDMEASMAAGKDVVETPSYSAKFDVKGTSPLDILSMKIEGSGLLAITDSIKAHLKSSFSHKFIEASVSIVEDATITHKIDLRSNSKIEATSPFGLNIVLEHNGMAGFNTEEISADSSFEGMFKAGPMYGKTSSSQSFSIFPFRPEANIDSKVQIESTFFKADNTIAATLANGEFSVVSNTNAFEDTLTHVAELSFKNSKLSLKCDANALALGMKIRNQAEASAGAGEVVMRMETNADHFDNRLYSLLTASLDVSGLALNSDATMKLLENEATHKATLRMNKDGITTSGTTTVQSPLALENTFNAGLDASRATLSITNKAAMRDIKVDNANTMTITLSSFDFNSKAEATASQYASYIHDITIALKPYTASANVNNNMKLLGANFINEAQLQAELYKMDMTGSLKAIYGEEEIKHTYQHYPLAQLVRSSQTCNYKFDNKKKHMTSGSCTENHILLPFSHKGEYGVNNVGKQELTLVQVSPHNERVFYHSDIVMGLHMESVVDKSVVQDKDAGLNLLRELANLPETEGEKRAHLFHKLVTMVRGMKTETLSPAIPEALGVSRVLTYQVLAQCGTPECSSAIMQILRTFDTSALEVDAGVFAMGLVSNPSALLINDMLEMAKYKPSKPIMYALSNVVKRFYKAEGKLIPEIYSVAEFMAAQLGDCSGDKDNTFMTLRVIGNMAAAVGPALRAAVIQCVNQPAASPAVQQAAIQVYRLTPVPEEAREVLMQVLLDSASPMQKRVAAYLVLMKDPQSTELAQMADALLNEQDKQVKSFVISHITNILSSTEPETQELRQKIRDALQGNDIGPTMDPTKFSRNYKIGSVEGNMIFESTSYLPKEVMLEMTLKAFGYDIDMMEVGMEGKGFDPTIDALFGDNGFFPDTALKTMYFVSDNMPLRVNEIMQNMLPAMKNNRMRRQASQNLMRDIRRNLNKLVKELKTTQSPEAMVYLRLLGNELGYLRTNEITEMAYSAGMMIDNMFKLFPSDLMKALMTKADNTIFAHYIFMDNEFFLPTVTGVPLRVALSGTFTPGIKGGLNIARDMSEVTFMPSAGIEFVTQVGSHIPEYVNSGLEMHTNLFHESGLSAKISMRRDNVKLTIPAPVKPTKLIKMTNTLVAVTGSEVMTIPPMVMDKVDVSECTPVFAGMKYCTALQYTDAFSQDTAPYFPFTGDSKFAVELHPTGEVTEYTATVAYELLKEGEEGRQKVDSVNFILRAEGADPTEARAIMKYNRRKNVITADIQIPDYDVQAGLRLGVVDGNTKGKGTHSISLDFINKNIPQLSLVGRANRKAMKEGMLQVQLLVPSIKADATVTANMKRDEELELELKSEIKIMDTTAEQKITLKYDTSKIEVDLKSNVNSELLEIRSYAEEIKKYGKDFLAIRVGKTDMTVSQIIKAFVEATNNHMEKYGADIPYIQNFGVPDIPEISLPETLFLNTEAKAVYTFNNERFTIAIPLPLGGKSTEELNFPPALTTPHVSLQQFGLEIVSMEIPIPDLVVPESLTLSIPLFGKTEVSALMRCNLYDMEASMAAGKDFVETPSYSAKFDVKGTSPLDILSMKIEGIS